MFLSFRLPVRPALLALLSGSLLSAACAAHPDEARARTELVGHEFNLQIEQSSGAGLPTQGVIVRRYQSHGLWSSEGAGGANHRAATGSYQLRHDGQQVLVDRSSSAAGLATLTYHFDTPHAGRWTERREPGGATLSGRFSLVRSNAPAAEQLAPAVRGPINVALIIKSAVAPDLPAGSYPGAGLVLQTYAADGSLNFLGFGPGTINSRGTSSYRKMSANTAVEETIQTSDFFTLPYTMVYTYKTPNSGTWYQDFGNGLIRFRGTFDTFSR
jgi:hypothetical protein